LFLALLSWLLEPQRGEEIWAGKVQAPDSAKEMLATLRLPEWYAAAGFRAKWK
jgi:hypothetical protein